MTDSSLTNLTNLSSSSNTSSSSHGQYILNLEKQPLDSRDYQYEYNDQNDYQSQTVSSFSRNAHVPIFRTFVILHPFSTSKQQFVVYEGNRLPRAISWRLCFSYIFNQGSLGSCTANAGCSLFALISNKLQPSDAFSRLFLYYHTRQLEGTLSRDSGATLRNTMKALFSKGSPPERIWPYVISRFRSVPSTQAYQQIRKPSRGSSYVTVPLTIQAWEEVLRLGKCIVFGTYVFDSWFSSKFNVSRTGRIPLSQLNDKILGGHALLCIGYDMDRQEFQFLNSWGSGWGNQGFGTLPYEYMRKRYLFDAWIIVS